MKVTVPSWGDPWIPSELALVPVGVTPITVSVYVAVAFVPFVSLPWTVTGFSFPA